MKLRNVIAAVMLVLIAIAFSPAVAVVIVVLTGAGTLVWVAQKTSWQVAVFLIAVGLLAFACSGMVLLWQ